jgi:hypothetical protein
MSSLQLAAASYIYIQYITLHRKREKAAVVAKVTLHKQGSEERFTFAGRLEFLVGQWVIQEFHQNVFL